MGPKGGNQKCRDVQLNIFYRQDILSDYKRFLAMTTDSRLMHCIPKFHMIVHMIMRSTYQGNPTYYMVFLDESLNKLLKKTLRTSGPLSCSKHFHGLNFMGGVGGVMVGAERPWGIGAH